MQWNLSKVRAMACPGPACVLIILLAAAAGPVVAQTDVVYDLGRIGLGQLSILRPSVIYRSIDEFSGRPGGDAMGMGGAYLASASGAGAMGWNAAGLADLEHLSFSFDGYSRTANGSVGAYPDSLSIPGLSILHFLNYRTSLKGGFVPNSLAAGVPLWASGERRLVAAFGWRHYAEMAVPDQTVSELVARGTGASFPGVFSFDRSERGSLEAFSPALAFRAGPRLSLGAVLNVLDGGVRANTDQRFTVAGTPLRGVIRSNHRYSGFSPEFGGRASLGDRVSFGLRLVPGYTLKVRDGTFYVRSISAPGTPRVIIHALLPDYDLSIPLAFGAGVALRPTPRLLVAADMNGQSWSETKVTYTRAASDSAGLPLDDVTTFHFGAEYQLIRTRWGNVPVRVGFRTAPLGYREVDRRDVRADTLDTEEGPVMQVTSTGSYHGKSVKTTALSFGVSLETPGVSYDLGYESISYTVNKWFFDYPYDYVVNPSMAIVKVKQRVGRLRLSATYTF